MVAVGRTVGVRVMAAVGPGLSVRYSGEDDADAIVRRIRETRQLGSTIAILFDDIPPELRWDDDRRRYPTLAAAQADLLGRVLARTGTEGVAVCPTRYWGRGDEGDLAELAAALPPEVDLLWTGRAICSPTLETDDAARFARTAGRGPLYWDNYPVNDVAMTAELHIGPLEGRDGDLDRAARGLLVNAMELPESSKIAIATAADYAVDPASYDAEASWRAAISDLAGDAAADYLRFASHCRASCLGTEVAASLAQALADLEFAELTAGLAEAAERLRELGQQDAVAAERLLESAPGSALLTEARPWIDAFRTAGLAAVRIADFVAEGRPASGRAALWTLLEQIERHPVRVSGDLVTMALRDLIDPPARLPD